MSLIEEAKKLTFDPNDPFDLGYFIMDNAKSYLVEDEYPEFIKNFYYSIFEGLFLSESNAGIQYKFLADNVPDEFIKGYFLKMAEEEQIHGEIFKIFVDNMFGVGTSEKINIKYKDMYAHRIVPTHKNLLTTVLVFFIIETKVTSGFSLFYSDCKDPLKKNFIANFLAEETHHVADILDMIKQLSLKYSSRELPFIYKFYVEQAKYRKFYLTAYLENIFTDAIKLKNVYESTWHTKYLEKLNHKLFKVAEIINPAETYEHFVEITNPV